MAESSNPLEEGLSAFERAGTVTKLALVGGVGLAAFLGYRQYKAGQSSSSSSGAGLPLSSGDASTQTIAGSSAGQPIYVVVSGPSAGSGGPSADGTTSGPGTQPATGFLKLPNLTPMGGGGGLLQPSGTVRMAGSGAPTVTPRLYQGVLPVRR